MGREQDTFGPYRPEELISTGPRSQIWLARGTDDADARVVLKVAREARDRAHIAREAEVMRRVGPHPHLVRLLACAEDGRWLATERVSGAPMDQWAAIQDFDEILRVTRQLVDVLEHLHRQGVVHGDLKPSNVLVDKRGDVKLLDLGIATLPQDEVTGFRGTLGYAAPELLKGERPEPRCDVYGLGALLYTCVAQRTPFVASDPAALTYLPLVSLPPPPSAFRPELPSGLNQLLLGLLARDPSRRPASTARILEALDKAANSRPASPVLGMLEERETLRRAVVGTADGEPRVVVLYGPPGSGRRTLIAEAVEYARREGLPYPKGSELRGALTSLREADQAAVLVMRASSAGALKLAQLALKDGLRILLLLLAERPIPALAQRGAIHVTPAPLGQKDVVRLARMWGASAELGERWWQESLGHPVAVLGRIRAWRRTVTGEPPQDRALPAESRRVLELLRTEQEMDVQHLARALGLGEHALLDLCEVLFAEGLVEPARDGLAVKLAEAS